MNAYEIRFRLLGRRFFLVVKTWKPLVFYYGYVEKMK